MKIKELFNKPKLIGIIGDVNQAKSNFLYYTIKELKENFNFNLYVYGLRIGIEGAITINSLAELEIITNSVIILDEFASMFDLDNRKKKIQIENTLRLIHHNNNILILSGLPENFKKFISAKLDVIIYKKVSFDDLINGSRAKKVVLNYCGSEKGSHVLNMSKGEVLIYTERYDKVDIPYLEEYDTKLGNISICAEKVQEESAENVVIENE